MKVDPEHAGRHKIEAEVAGAASIGSAGFALYEHHQKKKSEHEYDEANPSSGAEKKHHNWF